MANFPDGQSRQDLNEELTSTASAPFLQENSSNPPKRDYWFLELLAKDKTLEPICKHPYITAFLDLHYSVAEKATDQMKDSGPHLALMLLLLELASTMGGRLFDEHENILLFAYYIFVLVLLGDIFSHFGDKLSNRLFRGSLVRDREISHKRECHQRVATLRRSVMHVLITYGVSITVLCLGNKFHDVPWMIPLDTESTETSDVKNETEITSDVKNETECKNLGNNTSLELSF